jgi:acyl-CoA reductase-like NAD-dependent aldehyde dehydrogenase
MFSSLQVLYSAEGVSEQSLSGDKGTDNTFAIAIIHYYASWADTISGQTIGTDPGKFAYTRHEPIGVVGQICETGGS